ncbi:hypothetical protein BSL78_00953 [Apostichopus japonicus]|uniref:Uncharacterized protein n=1 Tax=Stichopus japonicus TaxID=307972 RepID=A0A2G8LPE7_STIJA|nr:hypothetical protein BSL78_00953 [Apostichopus japonicus]
MPRIHSDYTITCVDNHSGGSADYWPVKKIPEYQGNPESPPSNSWTPVYHKKDVIEIGQAALGLVEEPDVTPPSSLKQSQSSLDRQNNNQQNSPLASSMNDQHKVNCNVASKEQSWVHDKNTAPVTTNTLPKNLVATKNQVEAKSNDAKSYSIGNSHFYTQSPQDQTPAQDRSGGMNADGWEQLYEKQKESRNDRAGQDTSRPAARSALNIRPIDTFDMSVFDDAVKISEETAKEEEVKGRSETDGRERKLKSFSSLDGQYEECGDGFLVHHNNAYIDAYDTHDSFVIVPTDTSTLPARGSSLKSGNNRSLATDNNIGSRNSSRDRNFTPTYSSRGYGTLPQTRSEPLKHSVSFSHGRPSIPQESITPAGGEMSYMEDSWEDLAANLFASGGPGPRPGASIGKPNRNEIKTTEVKRTMSLEPQARRPEWSGKTIPEQTSNRMRSAGEGKAEIGALWKQAKELMERSSDAETAGDNAVALGHSTQAAYKLKKLLGNSFLSSDQRILFRRIYDKTKDNTLHLEGKLNDENSLKSYSRSSSSGIEDDFHDIERKRRQPFLQDAVDDVKRSLPSNGATPVQHIPVTYWNGNSSATRGQTVINVPIIIEGSHGNRGYQGYNNTVNRPHMKPVLEVPVRVSSTLPRKHVPASRQFFVTAADSQGR